MSLAKDIASHLLKIEAVYLKPEEPFTWASGIKSPIYTDNRVTLAYPETRTLIRVTIDDLARAERRVSVLMGDKAAPRRQWIEDNVKFTLEENTVFQSLSTIK